MADRPEDPGPDVQAAIEKSPPPAIPVGLATVVAAFAGAAILGGIWLRYRRSKRKPDRQA